MPSDPETEPIDSQQPDFVRLSETPEPAAEGRSENVYDEDQTLGKLKELSKPTAAVLMTVGVAGVVMPGVWGAPLIVAGGLALAPNVFERFDVSLKQRFPETRQAAIQAMGRFLADMEKRFPSADE